MILVGMGANLPSPRYGAPRDTCEAALGAMARAGLVPRRRSRWYRSAPWPATDQPWYVNGVAMVEARDAGKMPEPSRLLAIMHGIEDDFGRQRGEPGASRVLDLDLLAVGGVVTGMTSPVVLPHPRMHERAFVLLPLAEVAPQWSHPVSGLGIDQLIAALAPGQVVEPMT